MGDEKTVNKINFKIGDVLHTLDWGWYIEYIRDNRQSFMEDVFQDKMRYFLTDVPLQELTACQHVFYQTAKEWRLWMNYELKDDDYWVDCLYVKLYHGPGLRLGPSPIKGGQINHQRVKSPACCERKKIPGRWSHKNNVFIPRKSLQADKSWVKLHYKLAKHYNSKQAFLQPQMTHWCVPPLRTLTFFQHLCLEPQKSAFLNRIRFMEWKTRHVFKENHVRQVVFLMRRSAKSVVDLYLIYYRYRALYGPSRARYMEVVGHVLRTSVRKNKPEHLYKCGFDCRVVRDMIYHNVWNTTVNLMERLYFFRLRIEELGENGSLKIMFNHHHHHRQTE